MIAIHHALPDCTALLEGLTRATKRRILLCLDLIAASLALALTLVLEPSIRAPSALDFGGLGAVVISASSALGLHRIKLNAFDSHSLVRVAALALITAIGLRTIYQFGQDRVYLLALAVFGLAVFVAAVVARLALLRLYTALLQVRNPRLPVLIYGAGCTGLQLGAALRRHHTIRAVAFVDDNPLLHGMTVGGLRVHPRSALPRLARDHDVTRIILAMPGISAPRQASLARDLHSEGLQVQAIPSFAQLIGQEAISEKLIPITSSQFLGRAPFAQNSASDDAYLGRVVMVTGAGGSIGSELCRQILACNPSALVLFDNSEAALYAVDKDLRTDNPDARVVTILGSVTNARLLKQVLARYRVEIIFHAAACKHVPLVEANPLAGIETNVLGTHILCNAAARAGIKRFVFISTDKAVRSGNVMGATKRLAELAVQDMGRRSENTRFAIVRFGNVLGSSGSVVPLFREQIARGGPVTLTHPNATRYFMTIAEAARLVLAADAFEPEHGLQGADVFMLDMGRPRLIRDLAAQMIEAAGYQIRDAQNPDGDIEITTIGLRPGEKLHEELLIDHNMLPTPHPKILRASERTLPPDEVAEFLRQLRAAVDAQDSAAARQAAFRWVEPARALTPSDAGRMVTDSVEI